MFCQKCSKFVIHFEKWGNEIFPWKDENVRNFVVHANPEKKTEMIHFLKFCFSPYRAF